MMAGEDRPEAPPEAAPDPIVAAREEFLRQVLDAAARGVLRPDEYAARVHALETATSVADMAAIVARPVTDAPCGDTPAPTLDPVDLARLMAPPPRSRRRKERSRYGALIAVVALFALLLAAGLWMAGHVHGGGGTIGGPGALGPSGVVAVPATALS